MGKGNNPDIHLALMDKETTNKDGSQQPTVFEASYHCSQTSSGHVILEAVKPEILIVSSRGGNRLGCLCLKKLWKAEEIDAAVLRTNELRIIKLINDGLTGKQRQHQ